MSNGSVYACRVIADALGGEVDAETSELSYNAAATTVADALMALSDALGTTDVTRTISGSCNTSMLSSIPVVFPSYCIPGTAFM